MPNNSNPKMNKKNAGLTRQASSLMALEPRFMFDGAAVDTAIEGINHPTDAPGESSLVNVALPQLVITARAEAQKLIADFLSKPDAKSTFGSLFNVGQGVSALQWDSAFSQLILDFQSNFNDVKIELISSDQLQGALGAFSAKDGQKPATIYLNLEWVQSIDNTQLLTKVMIEELGHAIDQKLNSTVDTPGDEGEAFAAAVLNTALSAKESQRIAQENDAALLQIDGRSVQVEDAASSFDVAGATLDFSVTSLQDVRIAGSAASVGETWLYKNVITISGQQIDAIVKFVSITSGSSMSSFDSTSNPYGTTAAEKYLQPNFSWSSSGGSAVISFSFILGNSYNAVSNVTGTAVTLRNVLVNSYDLDQSTSNGGKQFTNFTNIGGYELSSSTELELQTPSAGVSRFIPTVSPNNNITEAPGTTEGDNYRVRVSYDEISTLTVTLGDAVSGTTAFYGIDFGQGPTFTNVVNYDLVVAGGPLSTSESGTTDSFTVKLSAAPTANVTVTLTGLDGTEGSLSATTLTFTTSNWNTAQTVTVTGFDDADIDGDITYTLTATSTSTDTAFNGKTALIDVTNADNDVANAAPVANNDTGSVNENATLTVSDANGVITSTGVVSGVDTDADGNTLTVIGVTTGSVASVAAVGTSNVASSLAGTYGHLTLAANGGYSYLADASAANALAGGSTVTDVFTYAISDGLGGTSFATLTITVNGLNDASVMMADTNTVSEDTPASGNVLTNDSDVDNSLTVTSFQVTGDATVYTAGQTATITGKGSLLLSSDGSYTFTPVSNWNGNVPQVTYTVNTGSTSTLDITVTPVANTPSVLSINDATVEEGSKAVFTVSLSNASEEALEIAFTTSVTDPLSAEAGDIDPANLVVTYNDGTNDVVLTATAGKYTIPAGVTVLTVKVPTVGDAVYEGSETFTLSANVTQSYVTDTDLGTGTIKDDGTATDGDDEGVAVDDDRPVLSVAGVDDVSEGSYAVFTVSLDKALEGTTGIKLSLTDSSALIATDLSSMTMEVVTSLSTAVGSGTPVDNDGTFTLPAETTKFYVRVLTKSDQPAVYEGAEKFALRASFTSAALLYADRTGVNAAVRANASNADTSTILDDGTGKVYKPDGTEDLDAIKDDDRPKPEPLPLAVLPPAAPDRLAERVEPPPPVPQVFSSTLDPVAPRLVPIEPPRPIGDVLTSQSGYRIPANDTAPIGLSLNRGVTDQFVQGTQVATKISLPFDAFVHSDKDAVIKLEAKQADNRSLPKWVQFDPVSGVFEVTPPKGFKGKLDLKVVARDDDGREATALFQLFVGEQEKVGPQSRESFSEKLRMAGKRPITLIRVSDAQSKVTVRESMSQKVRPG